MNFLTDSEKQLINSNRYWSYKYAFEIIEQKLMTEINNILSGKRVTYDSISMVKKLTELKRKT